MATVVADLNAKTPENAKRQFVELYGSTAVMNTYLKIALLALCAVCLGLSAVEVKKEDQSVTIYLLGGQTLHLTHEQSKQFVHHVKTHLHPTP